MPVLFQLQNASKRYGDQILLDDTELTLTEESKVGFVGRNGAGKSTLLRIVMGEEDLDAGDVQRSKQLRVGYLRQHAPFLDGESALDFLMRDSGKPDWKCGEVAGQFELKGDFLYGPVAALSGGWQTRVKLAALLLHEPNLLLLDEPTNFLDLRTQILLEHFLRGFRQACLIVSHDRAFLKKTCTHTLDLSRGKLTLFPGPIDAFLEYQTERLEHDRRVNATVMAKQKQLKRFIDKNRANASTASQAKSKAKQLAKLQTTEIETNEPNARIRAPIVEPRQGPAVRCEAMEIGYPTLSVASRITLEVEHGQRAAFVGDNGQGKTTLLRTLVGSIEPLDGKLKWGFGCRIGTYAQHVYSSLPEYLTVYEYLDAQALPNTTHQQILKVAGALLFRDSHTQKKIKVLSGGERARLCMAGLMLGDYNVLVLDEPGNHLDVQTVESLADALLAYQGTILFTSHDRHFMKRIATNVIEVRNGRVRHYSGSYDDYVYAIQKEIDEGERQRLVSTPGPAAGVDGTTSASKPRGKAHRQMRKKISNLEKTIARLDDEKKELNRQLLAESDPQRALDLHNQLAVVMESLNSAEERWLELQETNEL